MKIIQVGGMPYDYDVVLFGDDQEGNALTYHDGVAQCVDFILAEKNRYAVHMGDEMDAFYIDDPRYDPDMTTSAPNEQKKAVVKKLLPLAKEQRLLSILFGNHTLKLMKKWGNVTRDICDELRERAGEGAKWPVYGSMVCKMEFSDDKGAQHKFYLTHGRKIVGSVADDPIREHSNMILQLKRHLKSQAGDCILMAKGHTHKLLVGAPRPVLYLTTEKGKIKQHYTTPASSEYIPPENRYYVNTGSFLKGQGVGDGVSYSEMAEYPPVELGFVVVEIRNREISDVRTVVV